MARSGASTVAELAAAGKPALLVPFAAAADDHQKRNAEEMVRRGCRGDARGVGSGDSGQTAASADRAARRDPARLAAMAAAARTQAHPAAAERIADRLAELAVKASPDLSAGNRGRETDQAKKAHLPKQMGLFSSNCPDLPVSAAAMAAATLLSAAAESAGMAAAAEAAACAAAESATGCRGRTARSTSVSARHSASVAAGTARIGSATRISATSVAIAAASVSVAATAVAAATAPAMMPAPSVPRANADEDAAVEPVRSVIAIRGAGVGVVGVVAPLAVRRTIRHRSINDRGANPHSDCHLGVCVCRQRQWQSQNHREQNQSHTPHDNLPMPACPVQFLKQGSWNSDSTIALSTCRLWVLLTRPASDY